METLESTVENSGGMKSNLSSIDYNPLKEGIDLDYDIRKEQEEKPLYAGCPCPCPKIVLPAWGAGYVMFSPI